MKEPLIGAPIAERRLTLRLSMREAARKGGVSPTTWSNLESGAETRPTMSTQRAVARVLGWELGWYDVLAAGETPQLVVEPDAPAQDRSPELVTPSNDDLLRRLEEVEAELNELRGGPIEPAGELSRGERKRRWREIGETVTARMNELDRDWGSFARIARLNPQFVRRVMKGSPRGEPGRESLYQLAAALGWSIDSFDRMLEGGDPIVLQPGDPEFEARREWLDERIRSYVSQRELLDEIDAREARKRQSDVDLGPNDL